MSKYDQDPEKPSESQILGALYGLEICEYPGHMYMPHVDRIFGAGFRKHGGASAIDVDREWYGGMPLPVSRKERDLEARNSRRNKPAGAMDKYSMNYML